MSVEVVPNPSLMTDTGVELPPDHGRVITRFFVPGNETVGPGDSRAAPVIERIMLLDEAEVERVMVGVEQRFAGRHRDLDMVFDEHADLVRARVDPSTDLTESRRRLLGACFTHEFSIEGAALCNPAMVMHPEQPTNGDVRFVMSVRGIGEGHRSSIGFRTGTISPSGTIEVERPGRFPRTRSSVAGEHRREVLHRKLAELDDDHENAAYVLDSLPETFSETELRDRMLVLVEDATAQRNVLATVAHLQHLIECSYRVDFDGSTEISERVLWPRTPAESNGMEDARFVRFSDGDRSRYVASYTAYDGARIVQQLLETDDFSSFCSSPLAGAATAGKGLALFPRRIDGRFAALSRSDRETNSIAFSDSMYCWDDATTIQAPQRAWDVIQLGNCGSPIETAAGWLVLTHGVGPMRTYSLGAILLDLERPERLIAVSDEPILVPPIDDRGGYVPSVVYTCGAMVAHEDLLVIPYGVGDQSIAIATCSVERLVSGMRRVDPAS